MAFSNIYDLYNKLLIQDQPLVDSIVNNVKFKIEEHIALADVNSFTYDTNVFLVDSDTYTKDRVIDQVIKYFRNRGIRIRTSGSGYNGYPFPGTAQVMIPTSNTVQINGEFDLSFSNSFMIYEEVTFESSTELNRVLIVEWFIRYRQEFMKHYC